MRLTAHFAPRKIVSMNARTASIERNTRETRISLSLDIDGTGKHSVHTGIPFLDHMLEIFSRHSLVDLELKAEGDTEIDDHHTMEDVGLVLGSALNAALGDRRSIRRYGSVLLPMDDALSRVAVDISGRPYLVYKVACRRDFIGRFDVRLVEEFFRAVSVEARMNLHIESIYGDETHHIVESVFKGFARAMREAAAIDPRECGIPSSKGII